VAWGCADSGGTLDGWGRDAGGWLGGVQTAVGRWTDGRRESPGIGVVSRLVAGLLAIDERRGGDRIRQYGRVLSAGFESDVVYDLREYATSIPLSRLYDAVGATEVASGGTDRISGHTVIDSIRAITRLSSEEFFRLYGQSTNRVLVFTGVTRGESPLVALRVVNPTPNAVILHGIDEAELWDHAGDLARIDGYSLAVTTDPLEDILDHLVTLE